MEETIPSGIRNSDDLIKLAHPFAELINQIHKENGDLVHDVVSGGLYAMGCALAQIGVHIDIHGQVSTTLPPLSMGYSDSIELVKKKMI